MVNTLALMLSPEERKRSRYAVETLSNDGSDLYDSDLFVQGLLKVTECGPIFIEEVSRMWTYIY